MSHHDYLPITSAPAVTATENHTSPIIADKSPQEQFEGLMSAVITL